MHQMHDSILLFLISFNVYPKYSTSPSCGPSHGAAWHHRRHCYSEGTPFLLRLMATTATAGLLTYISSAPTLKTFVAQEVLPSRDLCPLHNKDVTRTSSLPEKLSVTVRLVRPPHADTGRIDVYSSGTARASHPIPF